MLALFLLPGLAWSQSHEILRPTIGNTGTSDAGLTGNCQGTLFSGTGMPNAFDAAGLSTSSAQGALGGISDNRSRGATFKLWSASAITPTTLYTALTLNVNSQTTIFGTGGGLADVSYSLNAGTTWTSLHNGGPWNQVTDTAVLSTAQDLSKVWVNICEQGNANGFPTNDPGTASITVWDIWTDGTYTSASGGNGSGTGNSASAPVIVSMAGDIDDRVLRVASSLQMPVDIRDTTT